MSYQVDDKLFWHISCEWICFQKLWTELWVPRQCSLWRGRQQRADALAVVCGWLCWLCALLQMKCKLNSLSGSDRKESCGDRVIVKFWIRDVILISPKSTKSILTIHCSCCFLNDVSGVCAVFLQYNWWTSRMFLLEWSKATNDHPVVLRFIVMLWYGATTSRYPWPHQNNGNAMEWGFVCLYCFFPHSLHFCCWLLRLLP